MSDLTPDPFVPEIPEEAVKSIDEVEDEDVREGLKLMLRSFSGTNFWRRRL
jgi:hypothetical protein